MKRSINETPRPYKILRTASKEKNISAPKDPVNVYCRLRPLEKEVDSSSIKLVSSTTLSVNRESKNPGKETNYIFKQVFTSYVGQQEVFENVALPLLEDLINGKNGLLFTYGVTGSGKTFTLTGEPDNPGIIPSCISTLFNTIGDDHQTPKFLVKPDKMNGFEVLSESDALEERFKATKSKPPFTSFKKPIIFTNSGTKISNVPQNSTYSLFVSYIEIYNNNIYDLLDEHTSLKIPQAKILREDYYRGMYVNGAVEVEVRSSEEAFDVFYFGQMKKRMGNTILNAESSRSHSIFIIRVVQLQDNQIKTSQLSLVDLAGSERSKRTQTSGARLKEASSINNSLMSLRTCLDILRENQLNGGNRLVPYRDSRLTLLFKSYFEGLGQVRMIVCINPSFEDYEENIQVLKFAETSQDIKIPQSESKYTTYLPKTPRPVKALKLIHTPATLKAKKSPAVYCNLPGILLGCEGEDVASNITQLDTFLNALHKRREKRAILKQELAEKENAFRNRLLHDSQFSESSKDELSNIKQVLNKHKQITNRLENKVASYEIANNELTVKNQGFESQIKMLQIAVEEKNLQINRNYTECEKSKYKLALQTEKMSHERDIKLKRQYDMLQANMQHKSAKLQKVKDFLNEETPLVIQVSTRDDFEYNPQHTPPMPRRNLNKTFYSRRSRSAGDVYLEHNVVKPVPLTTILQPLMNKSKSVTKLDKAKDVTNAKQNRYCLIAQETDTQGDIETKLYKGDIVPTCGGGAQVIFDDIERLKQESPIKRTY